MAPPLVLWVLLAARATALSCVCTPSECEEVFEWECPGGGVVWDACGCCRICARVEDEPCGGPDGFHGSCAPGLHCVLDPSQLLPPRAQRGEARGTCKRVPGILVGAMSEDGLGEGGPGGPCIEGASKDSVFGCDIVGRVCRCSHLPACSSGDGSKKKRRRRAIGKGAGGRKGSVSGRGRGRRRRKRGSDWEEREEDKNPFTFSTLEECEMNLAEVLRQEEVPPSSGGGYMSVTLRNCTLNGCDTTANTAPGGISSHEGDSCPVGSARVEGAQGTGGVGSCVCLPSLCPSAYLPFSCPFGARVLRRASRIPGDCCDQYECASPPPEFREAPAETAKHESTAETKVPKELKHRALCPKGTENKTVIGCDIVGRVCRCTRLPACSSGGTRSRKRRKKGSGVLDDGVAGRRGEEDTDDVTASPFTFSTLDECKARLSEVLRKEAEEEMDESSDGRGE